MSRRLPFSFAGLSGEVAADRATAELEADLRHLIDPDIGRETLHWGRNYLYLAGWSGVGDATEVVVKQFRNDGRLGELERRLRGSKAERSWTMAWELGERGIDTPEPIAWIEETEAGAPSYYVSRYVPDRLEARYYIRALNADEQGSRYPALPVERFLAAVADVARRLHDHGVWHRDLSAGNLLLDVDAGGGVQSVAVVDINRARLTDVGLSQRMRDLCRLPLERRVHQELLLELYFGGDVPRLARPLFHTYHRLFHGRHRLKDRLRAPRQRLRRLFASRSTYPHIPEADSEAPTRDRDVWDPLSDQPHMHAGRWEKLGVRLRDAPVHATAIVTAAAAAPRIWRRFRQLETDRGCGPTAFDGLGVGVTPRHPELEAELVEELGLRHVLIRLQPWLDEHTAAETLAHELADRDVELAFALPQRRRFVREPSSWRRVVRELAARFTPCGRIFVVGQAINRSKWGIWNLAEYEAMAAIAKEVIESFDDTEVLGPGVIDFEPHVAAAAVNWPGGVDLDALATLLYVDRRGAPERTQLGLDAARKATLFRAIADTARHCDGRLWITEVNWPLREGPHAPAGRDVAVGEETAADYLARYYLLTLATGLVERVFWWQLIARGYGLVDLDDDGSRRRPAFDALGALNRLLSGSIFQGALPTSTGAFAYRFETADGGDVVAAWSVDESVDGDATVELPRPAVTLLNRDGEEIAPPDGSTIGLTPSVRYAVLR